MIKFFRTIRQSLLLENKTSQYIKYAIGEIVLVVIGILIALQINNWNNARLEKNEEKKLLNDLRSEFEKNLALLEDYDIIRINKIIDGQRRLVDLGINSGQKTQNLNIDSLFRISIGHPTWNPSLMVLDDLKNSGRLSKISNESLKQNLYLWYSFYTDYLEDIKSSEITHYDYLLYCINNGIYYSLLESDPKRNSVEKKEIDTNSLNDEIFISFLASYFSQVQLRKSDYLEAQKLIKQIIEETKK